MESNLPIFPGWQLVRQVNSERFRISARSSNRRVSFIFNTSTVVRPAALMPMTRVPSKMKWSDHRSRRG